MPSARKSLSDIRTNRGLADARTTRTRAVALRELSDLARETDRLFALIRQLRGEGIALIYISHRMAEVYELADRVSVLRDGSFVGTLNRDQLSAEAIVRMMVGRELSSFYTKTHDPDAAQGEVVMQVDGVTDGGRVLAAALGDVLRLVHKRYNRPVMVTETSAPGTHLERAHWMGGTLAAVKAARADRVPVVGYTWFPMFTMIEWKYRWSRRALQHHLLHLGLYDVEARDAQMERDPTPLVDTYNRYVSDTVGSVGEFPPPPAPAHFPVPYLVA